jgi:hypothetical protein
MTAAEQYCPECKEFTEFIKDGFLLHANGQKIQRMVCRKCGQKISITPRPPKKPRCKDGDCHFIPRGIDRLKNLKVQTQECTLCGRVVKITPKCPKCNSNETTLVSSRTLHCQKCKNSVIIWAKDAKGWVTAQ